ncbi:hypothetical protein LJC07_06420, partial [Christensenellaceae bacterium OttesenSCG-928-L17]|nr:hypothetical protein [Christensenellaceae bacterium OttesenSCG-928-L17]
MLKMLTAHTLEIDDEQEALHEILAQLNLAGSTCKHSIAMLSCHPDCVETGVAQYISAKLPFDTVGFTTISSRTSGAQEVPMLSIAVLTSDTVRFTSAWVPGLTKGATPAIKSAMQSAIAAGPGGSPSLIFPFFPFAQGISVEALMDTVMETARNVPMFGTISIDNTKDYSNCYTLYNGVASKTGFAAILFFGDITPRFFVAAVPSENLHSAHAIVTKSHQNILQEVNGKPFVEYLNSVGITDESGMMSVPFMVDSHDGAGMVARAIYAITPEG